MRSLHQKSGRRTTLRKIVYGMFSVVLLTTLTSVMLEQKEEIKLLLSDGNSDPRNEMWGKKYPLQYESYRKTSDTTFRSRYNSSAKDDMLAQNPNLVVLWAGYAFAKDYNQPRGHFYAVEDARNTLRTGAPKNENDGPQPATCWSCKSPDVPRMMKKIGTTDFYKGKWASLGSEVVNHIGCADCHDPQTMKLVITRPALSEALQRQGIDPQKTGAMDMKSMVCAQCHVEYFFKGEGKYLTFPWDKGYTVEDMEKYYDGVNFTDWTHSVSKAPMLKAQHPDYEIYRTSIHYQRGVSCSDCHMPSVTSKKGEDYTDHHIQSPLNNIAATCKTCHTADADSLKSNVFERQQKIIEIRSKLEELLVKAHFEAKSAWDAGAVQEEMKNALQFIRAAQWRWDFAAAGHGNSFHSPLETARIITNGIEKVQEARIELFKILFAHGVTKANYPDVSTKEKAQQYIGFDAPKNKTEKKEFLNTMVAEWLKKAKERESLYK